MEFNIVFDNASCFDLLVKHRVCGSCTFCRTNIDLDTWFFNEVCELGHDEVETINLDNTCPDYQVDIEYRERLAAK